MSNLIMRLLETSLVMSIVITFFIGFNLVFKNNLKAKWRYNIWLIIIISLVLPVKPNINLPLSITLNSNTQSTFSNINTQNNLSNISTFNIYEFLFIIWIIGVISFSFYYIYKNIRIKNLLYKWSKDDVPEHILNILEKTKSELNLHKNNIQIKICKLDITPMVINIKNPTILIPNKTIPDDEFIMILKHELIHCKRYDLIKKALSFMALIIHWFNPFVYLMNYKFQIDCEASCDEDVLLDSNMEKRILYSEAIIGIMENHSNIIPIASNQFYGGKNGMKKRLFSIINTEKRSGFIIPITIGIFVLGIGFFSNSVIAKDTNSNLSIESGKNLNSIEYIPETQVNEDREINNPHTSNCTLAYNHDGNCNVETSKHNTSHGSNHH